MNKHLKAYFDKTLNTCLVCGQYVSKDNAKEGRYPQTKHAMEHVQLRQCPVFSGKGSK